MKLQPDRPDTLAVTAHGPGWVAVNGVKHHQALLISSQGACTVWTEGHEPTKLDFEQALAHQPEVVIYGSGAQLRFASPAALAGLYQARVGIETMDTPAACRTFNILAGEGRRVVALLRMTAAG